MIDFELTEEHKMVQEMVRDFAAKEIAPTIAEHDREERCDRSLVDKMAELGLLGGPIPEKYGGAGLDYISFGLTCEELEYVDSSARTSLAVHVGLNSLGILTWGTEEQKQRFLVPQARGERLAGFALTEPDSGSDVAGMRTRAIRDGGYYILNGEKTWISLADIADQFLVFAYTDREAGYRGISAFVVERERPGFSSSSIHGKLGQRASNTGSLVFEDCRVPVENRIGEEGEGFKIAMSCLDNGRYAVAAGLTGLIRACLDASVAYAKERKAFGVPLGRHQLIKEKIAEMAAAVDIARLLYLRVGWMKNKGLRNTREASLAKWYNSMLAEKAAYDAVQIHGAYGYCDEYPVERFFRNAKGSGIYEGTHEIHKLIQADYALGYRQDRPPRCMLPPFRPAH